MGDATFDADGKTKMNGSDTATKDAEQGEDAPVPLLCSYRLGLALLAFFCFIHNYSQRMGMSVAIVCMVNHTGLALLENDAAEIRNVTTVSAACQRDVLGVNVTSAEDGPFIWSKSLQGHILGSFFYGYLISQIPGGMLAEKFGGKWVYAGSLGLGTVGTLLTPIAAKTSYRFLLFLRVLVGIVSGAMFPAMHAMWAQWAPPYERSRLAGISYAGAMMGNVVSLPISGLLCQYGFDGGWPSIFYVIGGSSCLILLLWMLLTSNTPAQHPRISAREKQYIMSTLKGQSSDTDGQDGVSLLI